MQSFNVKFLWEIYNKDVEFIKYFPETCLKKYPERAYFWKVFYVLKKPKFDELINGEIKILKAKNRIKTDKIKITAEAEKIFNKFEYESSLSLLGMFKS